MKVARSFAFCLLMPQSKKIEPNWCFKTSVNVPQTSSDSAYDAFISYIWKEGGDLPLTSAPIIAQEGDEVR